MKRRGLDEGRKSRNLGKKIFIDGSFKLVYFTVYLVFHETDEGADDQGDARAPLLVQEGRHLVDQRLARARGQQGEGAADQSEVSIYFGQPIRGQHYNLPFPRQYPGDGLLLSRSEARVAELGEGAGDVNISQVQRGNLWSNVT